jgi:hypothetical protein
MLPYRSTLKRVWNDFNKFSSSPICFDGYQSKNMYIFQIDALSKLFFLSLSLSHTLCPALRAISRNWAITLSSLACATATLSDVAAALSAFLLSIIAS